MRENRLPHAQLELVHQVRYEHPEEIESVFKQAHGEGILIIVNTDTRLRPHWKDLLAQEPLIFVLVPPLPPLIQLNIHFEKSSGVPN